MNDRLSLDEDRLRAVFQALGDQEVEYAVFGAVALGLHGLARATADLDLFILPDAGNVERLKKALRTVFNDPNIDSTSGRSSMTVTRYRSIEDMPRPWRDADDPGNLRLVAQMMRLHQTLMKREPRHPGVQRFRSAHEAGQSRNDPYRR